MPDRIVKVREQGRLITRGITKRGTGVTLKLDDDERQTITIDWSGWLGSDTIASVENESYHVNIDNLANTDTTVTMTLSAEYTGCVEHRITTAVGEKKELKIWVDIEGSYLQHDYQQLGGLALYRGIW